MTENLMQHIVNLCKRRGFITLSSEPYGGFGSCYDYGPLGVELKNNIKQNWWTTMTRGYDNIVGVDSAILMSPKVWEASGHLSAGFADELVECKQCHKRFKLSDLDNKSVCPECQGELLPPRHFNIMMKTFIGPVEDSSSVTYLRGETCQGIFMDYQWVLDAMRLKIPFGIAQIGKAFRNEINPNNFIFRTREFEQMEMEFFVHPNDAEKYFEYFKQERMQWYIKLGIKKENLRFYEHKKDELAHYAIKAFDIEYHFPFGWQEIEGIHNRGQWDLGNHSKFSGKDLSYFDPEKKETFIPFVIETSAGADRVTLAVLLDAYDEIKGGRSTTTNAIKDTEIVLHLHPKLAPVKCAILPLLKNKIELVNKAKDIYNLWKLDYNIQYDETGTIGKRYRRQDEIGTPWCLTIDFDTLKDNTITIRDRDTMSQKRIAVDDVGHNYFNF